MKPYSRQRRVHRIRLGHPIIARFATQGVVLIDLSLDGAKIEHNETMNTGLEGKLSFDWEDERIELACRVTRCRLERLAGGRDGLTIYHSGLYFTDRGSSAVSLKKIVSLHISRALEEQRANARGELPVAVDKMPIFRGHTLTANQGEATEGLGIHEALPAARIARQAGYICYRLDKNNWKRTRTDKPDQPENGFTVSATEDLAQIEELCETYRKSDQAGRELIRSLAKLSVIEGEGTNPGRFDP